MGGPKVSKAMRTMSIARTTPAQKPRGLSNSKVFSLASEVIIQSLSGRSYPQSNPSNLSQKASSGQRKPQKSRGLALFGLIPAANGIRHGPAAVARHYAAMPPSGGLR